MSDWLRFGEVLDKLKINDFELIDLIIKGLQPFDIARTPLPPPSKKERLLSLTKYKEELSLYKKSQNQPKNKYVKARILNRLSALGLLYKDLDARIEFLKSEIKKLEKELSIDDLFSWKTIKKPETSEQVNSLIAILKNSIFKTNDIEEIGKKDSWKTVCSDEIKSLLKKVKPKLETLYNALKKDGLYRKDVIENEDERIERFKKDTLKEYKKSPSKYKFIEEEYLQNPKLYILTQQKEKRDFIGRLLRKIVQDKNLGLHGEQSLYKCYLTIPD